MLQTILPPGEVNVTATTTLHPTSTMKTTTTVDYEAEHRASLDRFAYIYIACEGAMIALVLCLLAVGYCVYKYRQRQMALGGRIDKYRGNAYSTATSTVPDTDHVESLFISESLPS